MLYTRFDNNSTKRLLKQKNILRSESYLINNYIPMEAERENTAPNYSQFRSFEKLPKEALGEEDIEALRRREKAIQEMRIYLS